MRKMLTTVVVATLVASAFAGGAVAGTLITSADIKNQTIRSIDIGPDGVGSSEIKTSGVRKAEIAADSVGFSELTDGVTNAFRTVRPGETIRGAVGGDFDAHATLIDWGVVVSLPAAAPVAIGDDDVAIDVSHWISGDDGQTQPDTTDTDAGCTGSVANPTAPAGTVCVYVAGGDNATDVNGYSVRPGTGTSRYGFKVAWTSATTGDTFIDAVWAYTAP